MLQGDDTQQNKIQGQEKYLRPFLLVTSLFFLWGLAYGLLDVLNKHFQVVLRVNKAQSTLLQMAYFGAYFIIALPAGFFMNRYGYKKGIITGLLLYATGAFLFFPSALYSNFYFFLLALFILASGLAFLESAANPYVTVLGDTRSAAFRLNLSQSFNGIGSFIGPIIAANLFFNSGNEGNLHSVKMVYVVIGIVVLLIAVLFWKTLMPEIRESELVSDISLDKKPLFKHNNFAAAVIAQFFYVAAQVGVSALFLNYCTEADKNINDEKAAYLLSTSLLLFAIGRFSGAMLMRVIKPQRLLFIYSLINIGLCCMVVWLNNYLSVYVLVAIFFFESIMFPTIFTLGIKDLGHHTKKASSFIIMAVAGGAFIPFVMGIIAEKYSTAFSYTVPMCCFIITAWYGWKMNSKL